MVTAKGGTKLAEDGLKLGRDKQGGHGEAVGYALGHSDEVGTNTQVLMGEKLTATAIAALYLITDEHRVGGVAELAQPLHKLRTGHANTSHALDTLDDDGAHIALLNLTAPRLQVVEGQIGNMVVGIDRGNNLGVGGGLYCQGSATVESPLKGENTGAAVMERGEFEGILVGLSTGVDEEKLIVFITAGLAQTAGKLLLQGIDDGVAIEAKLAKLRGHSLDIMGMAVAHAYHGMATVEVEVLTAIGVPHAASLAVVDGYVEKRIYIEEKHLLRFDNFTISQIDDFTTKRQRP